VVFQAPPLFSLVVKFTATSLNVTPPSYASEGSAAFDFPYPDGLPQLRIAPGQMLPVPTGLYVEVPKGYQLLLFARSGNAFRHRVSLQNGVGIIDSDYRGEIVGLVSNAGPAPFFIDPGDRFMQGQVLPVIHTIFVPSDSLSQTERGAGGFGSTGA